MYAAAGCNIHEKFGHRVGKKGAPGKADERGVSEAYPIDQHWRFLRHPYVIYI